MGGTLGRYGSTSVENIDDLFFSTIANLTKTACTKRPKTLLKLRRADRGELFTANDYNCGHFSAAVNPEWHKITHCRKEKFSKVNFFQQLRVKVVQFFTPNS